MLDACSHIYKYENVHSLLTQVETIVLLYLGLSFMWIEVQWSRTQLSTEDPVQSRFKVTMKH